MEKYIVNYETAVKLKEIRFDEFCYFCYANRSFRSNPIFTNNTFLSQNYSSDIEQFITAPFYDQVLEWFRSKGLVLVIGKAHKLAPFKFSFIIYETINGTEIYNSNNEVEVLNRTVSFNTNLHSLGTGIFPSDQSDTYEEARQKGIDWIINKIKDGRTD